VARSTIEVYKTKDVVAATKGPSGRSHGAYESVGGNVRMFGCHGENENGFLGSFNDVWGSTVPEISRT